MKSWEVCGKNQAVKLMLDKRDSFSLRVWLARLVNPSIRPKVEHDSTTRLAVLSADRTH